MNAASITVIRKGRSRKPGERKPSGDRRRERGDPRDRGMYHRLRDSANQRYGVLKGEIGRWERDLGLLTQSEAQALTDLGTFFGRYYRLMGLGKPTAASASFEMGFRGPSNFAVHGELERLAGIAKRDYDRVRDRIPDGKWWDAIYGLCVENRHVSAELAPGVARIARDIGTMLANRHKTEPLRKAQKPKAKPYEERAKILVDALEDWFDHCGNDSRAWRLYDAGDSPERGIVGFNMTGQPHTLRMNKEGADAGAFDMAIVRAAQAKGWEERE